MALVKSCGKGNHKHLLWTTFTRSSTVRGGHEWIWKNKIGSFVCILHAILKRLNSFFLCAGDTGSARNKIHGPMLCRVPMEILEVTKLLGIHVVVWAALDELRAVHKTCSNLQYRNTQYRTKPFFYRLDLGLLPLLHRQVQILQSTLCQCQSVQTTVVFPYSTGKLRMCWCWNFLPRDMDYSKQSWCKISASLVQH